MVYKLASIYVYAFPSDKSISYYG